MVPRDMATHSAKGHDGSIVTMLALMSTIFGGCSVALGLFSLCVITMQFLLWVADYEERKEESRFKSSRPRLR